MKRVTTAVLFVLCVVAPTAWAGSLVTVVDEVRVDAVVDNGEFLLEDGRRLILKHPVAEPDALIGRLLRVIATVDPRAPQPALTAADLLPPLVGAAFDLHAGKVQRAPSWVQKSGFEWLHRVIQEPGRLWKRYLVTNSQFIWYSLFSSRNNKS